MRHDSARLRAGLRAAGCEVPEGTWRVGEFGDGRELSARLLELVARGVKTATSALLWDFEADGEPLPGVGDLEMVVTWDGIPAGLLEYRRVEVLPFEAVPEEFAREEGEGDLSLEFWRRVHWEFFSRRCRDLGREPARSMPVVCTRFRVLHWVRPGAGGA